ncbi:MAG: glycerophosphodiester phosphodiesterase, partial [Ruminococcus sp. SR1/5]|nr:glycerophosphodiester phosphodiesterase [Ruminococcus sp.]
LREYLEWMAEEEDLITNIELKNSVYYYGGMEEKVIDMICEYGLEDRIILSSFNNASIVLCRQSDETIAGGFLVEKYVDNAGVYARTCDVQYYHPNLEYLKEEHVRSCSQNGIGVNVWTVNEEEDMRRMKKWGVNSIITNYPDRGRAVADED